MKTLRIACVCVFLAAGLAWADELWDRETKAWERKDADKILNSSPWGKRIPTKSEYAQEKDKSAVRGPGGNSDPFERGNLREDDYAMVWWWSARTPRRAFMRIYELSGGKVSKESAEQFTETKAQAYLVSVMGGGPMVGVSGKLSPEELKKAAWLYSPRLDKKIEAENAEVVMAGGKPDRILFMFPKEVDGKALITAEDKRLLFRFQTA